MRTETRSYQVHDYFVETNVRFQFNNAEVAEMVREEFKVKVTGERAKLSVNSSKNYFLLLENDSRSEDMQGGTKYVDLVYKVRLVPTAAAKSVLGNDIQNVSLKNGILTFKLGAGFNFSDFSQQIRLFKNRRLRSDVLVLDKLLTANEMDVQSNATETIMTVDLNSLGVKVPAKKRVIIDTKLLIDEKKLLNKNDVKTKASANWIFR